MADLEHVDVVQHALVDQRLQHVGLGISRQHRREAWRGRQQHHAGLVGRGVLDRRRRRDGGERDATRRERVACLHLSDGIRTTQALGGRQNLRLPGAGSRR
jgi:hypothetical protein